MSKPAKTTLHRHPGANPWTPPANRCRLTTIASVGTGSTPSPISFAYRYNAANQRVQANREDGAQWRYEYDKLGQVVSGKKYWSDGTPVPGMQFVYGFDDIGNRQATAAGGNPSGAGLRPASYAANLLNQYTSRTVPGGFDVLGAANATNAVTVNGSPADYRRGEFFQELLTANNTNATIWQSVKVTNTASGAYETGAAFLAQSPEAFTYDADGNLLTDGRWDYTWDAENRLIQMQTRSAAYTAGAPRQKLVFGYDWQGHRISKTVSNWVSGNWSLASTWSFIYDGWNLLAILDPPSSILQSFLWGLDLSGSLQGAGGVGGLLKVYDATTEKHYFPAYDGNGNLMALVNGATGAESARYEYGPFGEPLVVAGNYAAANPFRFSTKFTDEQTGLLYYGYRSYNPAMGRWLNRDPIEESGGANLHGILANNPIDAIDGDGRLRVSLLSVQSWPCKEYALKYAFFLDRPAPCDGYFVMENIVYHTDYDCCLPGPFTMKTKPLAHFWEAWEVKQGEAAWEYSSVMDATDNAKGVILKPSRTFRAVVGTLKFYCRSVTGDLGGFARDPGTPNGGWGIGHRLAGLLPATIIPPQWWNTAAVEGPAARELTLEGYCCADRNRTWMLTHNP